MAGQIIGNCTTETPHTGVGSCPKQMGKIVALIVTTKTESYPMDATGFKGKLVTGPYNVANSRMYPIKDLVGMTINGGDINAQDVGTYGGQVPVGLNAKNVAYQVNAGDCMYKELMKLNRRKMRVFLVDEEGYVYGTVVSVSGASGNEEKFAGFEATLYATRVPTDGSTPYNLSLYVYYTANNENEEKNMHAIEIGLTNIPDGLIGVTLVKGSAAGKARVITACGGEDLTLDYAWDSMDFLNESGTNPTSVTKSGKELTFEPEGSYRVVNAVSLYENQKYGLEGIDEYVSLT